MQNKLNKKRKHYSVKIYTKPNNMNNEQLNAAKDKAAQEAGYNTFNELISVDGYLSDNITLINRAMEIYAQLERTEGIRKDLRRRYYHLFKKVGIAVIYTTPLTTISTGSGKLFAKVLYSCDAV